MAEIYVRTEALRPGETFPLADHEAVRSCEWGGDGKYIYLVILGDLEAREREEARGRA